VFFAALLVGGLALFVVFFLHGLGIALCDSGSCPSDAALRHAQGWQKVGLALAAVGVVGLIGTWWRRRRRRQRASRGAGRTHGG
jgi:hypothetical protein